MRRGFSLADIFQEVEIPIREEEINGVVDRYARKATYDIISKLSNNRILFRELFSQVRESVRLWLGDPGFSFQRTFFIKALLAKNSNIAFLSNGAEIWVTYAHLLERSGSTLCFDLIEFRSSKASEMRQITRRELSRNFWVKFSSLKKEIRETKGKGYNLQPNTLLVRNSLLVLLSGQDGHLYVTMFHRLK